MPNSTVSSPLLTIAIPTWNRARFLAKTLEQLHSEMMGVAQGSVEVLVSDNDSPDETQAIVAHRIQAGLPITNIKNPTNIGSDANIAQCFNLASGKYVLILGDDDLLVDQSLSMILSILAAKDYGVVCLSAYGFEDDFRKEFPGNFGRDQEYLDSTKFLVKVGAWMTFISSCIINRQLISEVDANAFCGSNLVQVELVLRATIAAKQNYFVKKYAIACLRNNSSGYEFSTVFVNKLGAILDKYQALGLQPDATRQIENKLLLTFFPFYLTRQRIFNTGNLDICRANFTKRYKGRLLFSCWVAPIMQWPRPLAVIWGAGTVFVGRGLNGDLQRGVYFAINKIKKLLSKSR